MFAQEGASAEFAAENSADNSTEARIPAEDTIIIGEAPAQGTIGESTSIWIIVRMVLVLALAALAIYGVVFFIKRLARPPQARDPYLKVLASVPLGTDGFASVISLGTKAWLVGGGSGGGISLIAEISEQETLESMLLEETQNRAELGTNRILDFRSLLYRLGRGDPKTTGGLDIHADSLRKQRDRLKGL
jgi:flagellar protein FliO/FliZ